jgi:glycosyltransferase involved in cell wall biosynthesis
MEDKKIKILLITPYFKEPHRWMISAYKEAINFAKNGYETIVFTSRSKNTPKLVKKKNLKIYGYRDIFLKDPINFGIMPFMTFHLLNLIRKEKPTHIIISKHMFYTSLCMFPLKLMRKKVTVMVDTFPGQNWLSKSKIVNFVLKIYSRTIGKSILKLANKVIIFHEDLINLAKSMKLNYKVIHNGVDLEKYESAKLPEDIIKKDDEIIITYTGRLESIKNYPDIIEVAKKITPKNKNITFLFAGDITGKEDEIKKVETDQIKFLGYRKDIPSLLKISDIFILASSNEGLPNSLMEAMAAKCACISTNVGGVKSLIKENENGLLFEIHNLQELEEKINYLVKNKETRINLGLSAHKKIKEEFNWEKIVKEIIKEIK